MADINNLDDEQRLNDILSERKNIIDSNNESLEKTSGLTSDILNIENEINNALVDEKEKHENINNEVENKLTNESEILDVINDINNALEKEKNTRGTINSSIDEQKNKLSEVKITSEEMSSAITSAITEQVTNTQNLINELANVVTSYNNIGSAAQNAAQQSNNINPPQQPNGNTQSSGNTTQQTNSNTQQNTQQVSTNSISSELDKYFDRKGEFSKKEAVTYLYEGIKNFTKNSFHKWVEIDDKVHKVGRTIGMTGAQARAMVENITNEYGNMAQRLGMTWEEIFKFQENYNKNVGRGTILANEQVEVMAGLSKLVGDAAVEDIVKNMDDLGASTDTATLYLTQNMARAKAHGLDAKKTSEAFANNIKLASKYNFREGVNGISKMTLLSQKLKFNMDSIANAAEKFETVEGAIGTAANLQMLGGSFAAQFGNPLEAMNMAMLDMEGFTNKIVDTFSGKAIFNRETGQAEMSAIDKRFLKEAAKQLGLNYEDAWNIVTQSAKIKDVERSLNPVYNFSEEDKALIANKSIFKDGKHQITFYGEDNEEITKSVDQLTKDDLKFLTDEKTTEIAMADDVHGIKLLLQDYLNKTVKETKSTKEIYEGNKEQMEMFGANMVDGVSGTEWFKSLHDDMGGYWQTILLGGMSLFGNYLNNRALNSINKRFTKSVNGGSQYPQQPQVTPQGAPQRTPSRGGFWGKAKNALKNKKNKIGLAIGAATLIAGGLGLMSAADGSQVDKSKLGGREVEPNSDNIKDTITNNVAQTQELVELQKQTLLLEIIAKKQGVDVEKIYKNSTVNKTDIENNEQTTSVSSVLSDATTNTLIASQIGSTKVAASGFKAVAGRSGLKLAANMGKMVKAANPLGWISLGSGILKDVSGVEEGSGVDKAWSTANSMLDGASIGAMIGSVIPGIGTAIGAGVGTLVGGAIGIIDNYGKDIIDFTNKTADAVGGFLFGSDNMNESDKIQQQYEESKIGIVDIRDPQLEQKAQLATCQIHDIVISMWHYMNGKQSNGIEKDNGLIGNVGDSISTVNNVIGGALINMVSTPFKIIGGLFGSKNNTNNNKYNFENTSNPNTYYNSSNMLFDNILVKDSYYNSNSSVMSKPVVGTPTHIKKTVDFNSPSYRDNLPINNKLDLNVSGTIKLTTDKGQNVNLDIDKLLNNTEFVRKLTEVITNRLNKNSNGGRSEKNSVESINNSSSVKTRNQ